MVRIAVSPRAYRAIKATLPEGSDPGAREGRFILALNEATASGVNGQRRIGESEAIIRLAAKGGRRLRCDQGHAAGMRADHDAKRSV
jgi:hypothetical protein